MSRQCPKYDRKLGWNDSLIKCPKCGTVLCKSCAKGGGGLLNPHKCPACNTKLSSDDRV